MKKWWLDAICMLSVTAIALTGCKSATAAGELQLQPEKQEKTVLTLFLPIESSNTSSTYTYRDIISSFNAQSDSIEVRVEGMSTGDGYNEALERRLDEGKNVDLFMVNADSVKGLNSKGYFYDLSDQPVFNMLNDTARSQATVDGTAYCLPTKMSAYGLYVNVGLLEQYGLEPPQNADQFLHCCQVLKDNGITPISINRWYAMTAVAMGRGLYPIYQSGSTDEIISGLNDGSIKISEYMLEGFRFFAELVEKGYYGDNLTVDQVDAIKANSSDWEDFKTGKTAFAVFPTGKETELNELVPHMKFIQQGLPVLPEGTVSLPSVASRLCVNAKGDHLDESLTVLEYMTLTKSKELASEGEGGLSVFDSKNANGDPAVQALYADAVSPGQIPIEDMQLCFDYWGSIRILCLDIIGGATPEEAAMNYDRIQEEKVEDNAP